MLFVGVDGGGTKTAVAVVDSDGKTRGHARGSSSTFKSLGIDATSRVIVDAIGEALDAVGKSEPVSILVGVADVDTDRDRVYVRDGLSRALEARDLSIARLDVANDSVVALASGTDGLDRGVVCIAGTGSVALGLDGRGGEARAGGWGPPYGDGGSAYWIGFTGISRALNQYDRGQRDGALVRAIVEAVGCASLPEALYGPLGGDQGASFAAVGRDRMGALARAVEKAALAGDDDAQSIFAIGGEELAEIVSQVIIRLGMQNEEFDVVQVGGVWTTRVPLLVERFDESVRRVAPSVRFVRPSLEPAEAAALLIRRLSETGAPCPAGLIPAD